MMFEVCFGTSFGAQWYNSRSYVIREKINVIVQPPYEPTEVFRLAISLLFSVRVAT